MDTASNMPRQLDSIQYVNWNWISRNDFAFSVTVTMAAEMFFPAVKLVKTAEIFLLPKSFPRWESWVNIGHIFEILMSSGSLGIGALTSAQHWLVLAQHVTWGPDHMHGINQSFIIPAKLDSGYLMEHGLH